jgi:hypothetical protein
MYNEEFTHHHTAINDAHAKERGQKQHAIDQLEPTARAASLV